MRLPLWQQIPYPPEGRLPRPESSGQFSAWLESSDCGAAGGRYSYLAWDPFWVLEWVHGGWRQFRGPGTHGLDSDPFSGLEDALSRFPIEPVTRLPDFQGGAVGHFAYELAARIEHLPSVASKGSPVPLSRWIFADVVFAVDHKTKEAWAISQGWPADGARREQRARDRLATAVAAWEQSCSTQELQKRMDAKRVPRAPASAVAAEQEGVLASLERSAYLDRFAELHRYLVKGHLYQANLTIAFRAQKVLDPWQVHQALIANSPAPFASLLEGTEASVVSASPELFLRRRGQLLVTRPIKGTRPRASDPKIDLALAEELLASEKDLAEHVMIVDVHRNDLGRVCKYGSVIVPEPWLLESFATLHHLTSTITGDVGDEVGVLDPVRAAFPAGSITGAPKIRALEILADLEPHGRGAYTGALGWISPNGDLDLSVGIRTVSVTPHGVEFPAGGGIVVDSDAEGEYQEAWDKARSLWAALRSVPDVRNPAADCKQQSNVDGLISASS